MATITPTLALGPATLNITGVRAGDRNLFAVTLHDGVAPVDLTGLVLTAQARKLATDTEVAITADVVVTNAAAGQLTVAFPGGQVTTALAGAATWAAWAAAVAGVEIAAVY